MEQLQNCVAFADKRTGAEREGWLEDADFYSSAITLIDRALSPAPASKGPMEAENTFGRMKSALEGLAECDGRSTTLEHANSVIAGMGKAARAALSTLYPGGDGEKEVLK